MATWAEFANAEPDLAAFAWERMQGRIVYQATLRLDGGPRVHPVASSAGVGEPSTRARATRSTASSDPDSDRARRSRHGRVCTRVGLEREPAHPAFGAVGPVISDAPSGTVVTSPTIDASDDELPASEPPALFINRASAKGWRRQMVDLLGHARLVNALTLARCRARLPVEAVA